MKKSTLTCLALAIMAVIVLYGAGILSTPETVIAASALPVFGMAALTADRDTHRRAGDEIVLPAAAAKKFYAGALVARDASGNATPGAVAATLRGVGRCAQFVDNSGGGAGDQTVRIEKGVFRFGNSADGDLIARADIGADCYIVDDQTVAKTNPGGNTRSVAGKVFDVDASGVWVKFE